MSGHSKWSTIKRKKGATDAARGKLFTKYIKEITMAARASGAETESNPRLRTAIAGAKSVNMPAANIERAIKRGTGEIEGAAYEEIGYEGYGAGGVAILVDCATDNRNRTASEIRHTFARNNGSLGEAGSVSYLFKPRAVIVLDRSAIAEDLLMEVALEAGAEDVVGLGEHFDVVMSPAVFEGVKAALATRGVTVLSAEITKLASLHVPVDEKEATQVLRLIEALEDNDDVQKVYANFEMSDELLAKLSQ
ncbi:MAG: YebC/PmpR family DNA-binding transcriptional regulator [Candidatus Eisenbacteria bacterium]